MKKSIEQWLLELDSSDSILAMGYAQEAGTLQRQVDCMSDAINEGFSWANTDDPDHWHRLHIHYVKEEYEQSNK